MNFFRVLVLVFCPFFSLVAESTLADTNPTFSSFENGLRFLYNRHNLSTEKYTVEQLEWENDIRRINFENHKFIIFRLATTPLNSKRWVRGQNGPNYVFHESNGKFRLVAGVLGSRMDLILKPNQSPILHSYYHLSAGETPITKYQFKNGLFNTVRTHVEGDVFK